MYQGHIRLYFRRLLDGVLLRELHIGHVQDAFQRLFDEGIDRSDGAAAVLDAAVRPQRGRAGEAHPGQPGQVPEAAEGTKAVRGGMDEAAGQGVAADRGAARGGGETPAQLAQFLSAIASHPMFAAYHLIAMRGLRRGEECGLTWDDLDLDEGIAYVSR